MKCLIICGGRNHHMTRHMLAVCDWFYDKFGPFKVVLGGADGIDDDAEKWARARGLDPHIMLPKYRFPGDRQAPLIRNSDMAEYAGPEGTCLAFPALGKSNGTWDMIRKAKAVGMVVWRYDLVSKRLIREN